MSGNLIGGAIESFFDVLKSLFSGVSFDVIFALALGLLLVVFIVAIIRIHFSFERRVSGAMKKINKYLLSVMTITEENLREFHKKFQKMPQKIRERWQLFILERDGLPSRYLTTEYCIKRPLSTSVLIGVQKQVKYFSWIIAIVAFVLGFAYAMKTNGGHTGDYSSDDFLFTILYSFVVPLLVIFISTIFNLIIQRIYDSTHQKIYNEFEAFVRNINKAVATMPDTIDYQILFSQKEIDEGIPILRDYFEKQKLEQQQLLEQSKYTALAHSPYNFKELGVDGEQLITRAVDESENFLIKKIGLQNEIQDFEKKLAQSQANMDEIEKEANRKLQTIKENIERLNKAISETTNRVEINYNNRQIKDEIEKRAQIEKELKSLLSKEQLVANECTLEIEKRREMIEQDKGNVEVALKSEYNTFAVKVYDTLSDKLAEENAEVIKDYQNQILQINSNLRNLSKELEAKNAIIAEKDLLISNLKAGYNIGDETAAAQPQENYMATENVQQADQVVYDENGNAIDYSQYFDEDGNYIGEQGAEQLGAQEQSTEENKNDYVVETVEQPESTETITEQNQEQELALPFDGKMQMIGVEPTKKKTSAKKSTTQTKKSAKKKKQPLKSSTTKTATKGAKPVSQAKTTAKASSKTPAKATQTKAQPKKEAKAQEIKTTAKKSVPTKTAEKKSATKLAQEKSAQSKTEKIKTTKKEKGATIKVAQETLKSTKNKDDFNAIQKQINQEQEKLNKNKEALQDEIKKTLEKADKSTTETGKTATIKKIKSLIEQLKEDAKVAKAKGAKKEEVIKINKLVAELVDALTKLSSKK